MVRCKTFLTVYSSGSCFTWVTTWRRTSTCTWSLSSPVCPGTPAPRVTSASSSLVSSKTRESVISPTESKRYHLLRHLYNQLNLYNKRIKNIFYNNCAGFQFLRKVIRIFLSRILFAIHMYIFFTLRRVSRPEVSSLTSWPFRIPLVTWLFWTSGTTTAGREGTPRGI